MDKLIIAGSPRFPLRFDDLEAIMPAGNHLNVPVTLRNAILRLNDGCEVHANICCLGGTTTIYLGKYAFIQQLDVAKGTTCEIYFEGDKPPCIKTLHGMGSVFVHFPKGVRYTIDDCIQNKYLMPIICPRGK